MLVCDIYNKSSKRMCVSEEEKALCSCVLIMCLMWRFAVTQQEMWLLASSFLLESLLASILKNPGTFVFELFWCDVTTGEAKRFLDDIIRS